MDYHDARASHLFVFFLLARLARAPRHQRLNANADASG
jgi:hypothetical protein